MEYNSSRCKIAWCSFSAMIGYVLIGLWTLVSWYVMEYQLFGVCVVSKGAEKTRFNFHMIKKVKCEPLCTTPDSMTSFVRRKNTQTQWLVQAFQLLWYDWCEIRTLMQQSDWCEIHTLMWRSDWYEMQTLIIFGDLICASNIPINTLTQSYFLFKKNNSVNGNIPILLCNISLTFILAWPFWAKYSTV